MHWYDLGAIALLVIAAIPFLLLIIISVTLIIGLVSARFGKRDVLLGEIQRISEEVRNLSVDEARARAEILLLNDSIFSVDHLPIEDSFLKPLGPELREFFARHGGLQIDDTYRIPSNNPELEWPPEYLYLGQMGEHEHLLALPNQNAVVEFVDDFLDEWILDEHQSIYHWIVGNHHRF